MLISMLNPQLNRASNRNEGPGRLPKPVIQFTIACFLSALILKYCPKGTTAELVEILSEIEDNDNIGNRIAVKRARFELSFQTK